MPTFVFAYRNPTGYTRTPQSAAAWQAWFASMGGQLTDLGKPVVSRASLGECDPARTGLGGYSLITAPDLDAALAIAKGCPHLDRDGGIEVGQLGDVTGGSPRGPQAG